MIVCARAFDECASTLSEMTECSNECNGAAFAAVCDLQGDLKVSFGLSFDSVKGGGSPPIA